MSDPSLIVGYDPGFGNTKVCTPAGVAVLQSAIARPREIGQAAQGVNVAKRPLNITVGADRFVAGPGAWLWGDPQTNMDYTDLASLKRLSLFYATFSKLHAPGDYEIETLAIGLPVPLLQDQAQAAALLGSLKVYKGAHGFKVEGQPYTLEIKRVKALPQPVGAYADWALDEDSHIRRGSSSELVAVIDLGMNTLDLYVIQGWEVQPRYIGGDKLGVRRLLETMNGHREHDLEALDSDLRAGQLSPDDQDLSAWLARVMGSIERHWSSLRAFDLVIPTGGGASVLGSRLNAALLSKGARAHWPQNPLTANVEGFYKWGARR